MKKPARKRATASASSSGRIANAARTVAARAAALPERIDAAAAAAAADGLAELAGFRLKKPARKGAVPRQVAGSPSLRVTGFEFHETLINSENDESRTVSETINVPADTEFLLPVLTGWFLAFGSARIEANGEIAASRARTQQFGRANIRIDSVSLSGPTPPNTLKQAVVTLRALLQSGVPRKDWFATVDWVLITFASG